MKRLLLLALVFWAAPALSEVVAEDPWVRPTPPGAKLAAGYLRIVNRAAQPDRLVGASSAAAARVEMHVHIKDGEILRMRQVKELRIPAKGKFELRPAGAHLMFVDIKRPLREGEKLAVTLEFERAGKLRVGFRVGQPSAPHVHQQH